MGSDKFEGKKGGEGMREWKKVKLGESCTKIGSGATPKGGSTVYTSNGTSFIRSQNVYNLRFDYNGLTYINDEAAEKLKGVSVIENDILLNITGDSVARTCIVPNTILPARVNQHVAIIRAKSELLNQKYLNYYLASPAMQAYMLSLAVGKGASRNAITKLMIENFEVPCPSLEVQCRIAEILFRYDSLIENYQKQIKLLEESAQRLYKEWFVDLRFPGYENTKIVDGVPEGWDNIKVGDLLCKIKKTKQVPTNCYQKTGCIPIIDQGKDYIAGFTDDNECLIKVEKIPYIVFGDHTRILKYINFSFAKGADGTQLIMSNDQKRMPQSLLYCSLINIDLSDYSYARHFKYLKEEKILLPSEGIAKKYNEMVSPIYINIKNYRNQIHKLTEARDRLLPKLMSGEIEV